MEARELRLGNLFMNCQGGFQEVELSHLDYLLNNDFQPGNEAMMPIPLDESWLLRFGFVDGKWSDETQSHELYSDCKILFISDARDTHYSFDAPCNFVHQLQNLYFALTGTELTLKD